MRFLLLILVACGGGGGDGLSLDTPPPPKKPAPQGSGTSGSAAPKVVEREVDYANPSVDAVSKSTPIEGDPTTTVIERAFRNQMPAFPLLSKDGAIAACDVRTRIPPSGNTTYAIDFVEHDSTKSQPIMLIDLKLLNTLITARDTAAIPMTDVRKLVKTARRIHDRMDDDGYSRFEGQVEKPIDAAGVAAGTFKIRRGEELVIHVSRAKWSGETPKLEPQQMPNVGSIKCTATPTLRRVFFDNARKRVLVHLGWEPSADQCSVPDDRYYLVGPPS